MLTVWGRADSSNVQIVMWAAAELGLKVERIDAGHRFGGLDTPEFRAMNPMGRVPVIRDGDGPALFESAAILRYLAAAYGDERFWPRSAAARAPLDMWAEWAKSTFAPAFLMGVFWTLMRPSSVDPATREAKFAEAASLARIADARIGAGPYLGGAAFTFADIAFGVTLYRYFTLDFARAETPALEAYYRRLTERPAFAEHVMVSYAALRSA